MFEKKLKKAMQDLNLKQSQVAGMTGKSKGSISQYLSGKQVPSEDVQRDIAVSLGLDADYFTKPDDDLPVAVEPAARKSGVIKRLTVKEAATLLGVDKMTVSKGHFSRGCSPGAMASRPLTSLGRISSMRTAFPGLKGWRYEPHPCDQLLS